MEKNVFENLENVTIWNNYLNFKMLDYLETAEKENINIKKDYFIKKVYTLTSDLDLIKLICLYFGELFVYYENLFLYDFDKNDFANKVGKGLLSFKVGKKNFVVRKEIKVKFKEKEFEILNYENKIDVSNKIYLANNKEIIKEKIKDLKNTNHLTIHSPTGSGKTELIFEFLKDNTFNTILLFVPTSNLNFEFYNRGINHKLNTYIYMGKENSKRLNLNSNDYNLIQNKDELLNLLIDENKKIVTLDYSLYSFLYKGLKKIDKLNFLEKNKILLVFDEYHELVKKIENINSNKDTNLYNPFNCGYANMFYMFISATPFINDNGEMIATNILDFSANKTNIKNIIPCDRNYLYTQFLESAKNKESILLYVQNKNTINQLKEIIKKYYYSYRINTKEFNFEYPIATNTSKTSNLQLFDYLASDKNNINKFVILFTSSATQGQSINKDIDKFFIDCSLATSKTQLVQVLGRVRKIVKNCYITTRTTARNEKTIENLDIAKSVITVNGNILEGTNINLENFKNLYDNGFLFENELKELLKINKYNSNILDFNQSNKKLELKKLNKKENLIEQIKESDIVNFNYSILKNFGIDKNYFSDKSKIDNSIFSNLYISKNDLIFAIEKDIHIDFKNKNTINNLIDFLIKNKNDIEITTINNLKNKYGISKKIINFLVLFVYENKKIKGNRILKLKENFIEILTILFKNDIKIDGKLNQYITYNFSGSNEFLPIYLKIKDTKKNRENLKNEGYKIHFKDKYIYGVNEKRKKESIKQVKEKDIKIIYENINDLNLDELKEFLNSDNFLSLDIETKSNDKELEFVYNPNEREKKKGEKIRLLNPNYSYISNLNLYNKSGMFKIVCDLDNQNKINLFLENVKDKTIIIHNLNMECKFFNKFDNFDLFLKSNKFEDTLILDNMVKINKSSSLKNLTFCWSGLEYEATAGDYYNNYYMFCDVYYTYNLYFKIKSKIDKYIPFKNDLYDLYYTIIKFFLTLDYNYFNVNDLQLIEILEKIKENKKELKSQIKDFETPLKLKKYYYKKFNITLENTTKKYLFKVSNEYKKDFLKELNLYLEFKKVETLENSYRVLNLKYQVSNYTLLKTGRLGTNNPNLQGLSKNNYLDYPSPKKLIENRVGVDYSQLEIGVGASMYNLKDFLNGINKGLDTHSLTASKIQNDFSYETILNEQLLKDSGKKYNKYILNFRNYAKTFNFGLMYGMGVNTLYQTLKNVNDTLTLDEVTKMYLDFTKNDKDMEQVLKEKDEINFNLYNNLLIKNKFGRCRIFTKIFDKSYINTNLINYPIQSSASDLMLFSAVNIFNQLNLKTVGTVHDAYYTNNINLLEQIKNIMIKTANEKFKDVNILASFD